MGLIQMYKNRKKVLGMNERNLKYIRPHNLSNTKDLADDKIQTKTILESNNIPTPKLIAHIEDLKALREFDWDSLPNSFVMKPVKGLEGAGIEIYYNRDKDGNWIKADGTKVNPNELRMKALDIMDGKYSLHNQKDSVFFEERVKMHKAFKYYAYKGAPDVRVIIFNKIPIMSYVRLPTKQSNGKGNLAQGAIGAAIDISTGTTTTAVFGKSTPIDRIPGTNLSVSGLKIPYWNQILKTAIKTQEVTGLGYAAIDFLIDREEGPVIIELNARPGLSIQIANRDGLRWRLRKAAGLKVTSPLKGIRIAKDLFGGQLEEQIERISGKQIISHIMPVEIITEKQKKIPTLALIDTSRRTTTINYKLAQRAGIIDPDEDFEGTSMADVQFNLASNIIETDCRIVRDKIRGYNMLVGRRNLGDFLVDIRRVSLGKENKQKEELFTTQKLHKPENIDNVLAEISSQIYITRNIRPTNSTTERKKFFKRKDYNPQFNYAPINIDTDKLIDRLNTLSPDKNSKIGKLLSEKIESLKKSIFLIESIGDDVKFIERSKNLYTAPNKDTYEEALRIVRETDKIKPKKRTEKVLNQKEVEKTLSKHLKEKGIDAKIKFVSDGPKKASIKKQERTIYINKKYKYTKTKLLGTIAHEIDIHLSRAQYGAQKDYKIFSYGTAGYIEIEEGLAVWNKAKVLESKQPIRNAAIMYISAYLNNENSFLHTYNYLKELGLSPKNAYNFTQRTKKGITDTTTPGAYLKDALYFSGYLKVANMDDKEREKLIKSGKTHKIIEL